MYRNGSRALRTPTKPRNTTRSADHGHNRYNAYQQYIDNHNAPYDRSLLAGHPSLMGTGFFTTNADWPTPQVPFVSQGLDASPTDYLGNPRAFENGTSHVVNNFARGFLNYPYNAAPTYGSSLSPLSPPANGWAAHGDDDGYQHPLSPPLRAASPASWASPPANGWVAHGDDDGYQHPFSPPLRAASPASWVSPPANGWVAHGDDDGYQHPFSPPLRAASPASWVSPASTYIHPPFIVVASQGNGNSPPYQCVDCPNRPKFGSQKDLERHRITSRAHWSEETRFYRCCCGRYDRPRKDHHLRHIQDCDTHPRIAYGCICGRDCWDRDEHVEHVMHCGRIRHRRQSNVP
jgi:hypothetical protein